MGSDATTSSLVSKHMLLRTEIEEIMNKDQRQLIEHNLVETLELLVWLNNYVGGIYPDVEYPGKRNL